MHHFMKGNKQFILLPVEGTWILVYFSGSFLTIQIVAMIFPNEPIDFSSIRRGTKILFANVPADGHFNPLTGLAVHLKNLGCDVRWYTSNSYAEKIGRM